MSLSFAYQKMAWPVRWQSFRITMTKVLRATPPEINRFNTSANSLANSLRVMYNCTYLEGHWDLHPHSASNPSLTWWECYTTGWGWSFRPVFPWRGWDPGQTFLVTLVESLNLAWTSHKPWAFLSILDRSITTVNISSLHTSKPFLIRKCITVNISLILQNLSF